MSLAPNLDCGLVVSYALIRHLPKQTFIRPGEERDLDDQLRPHPMNP
jgi:hypothetical protein